MSDIKFVDGLKASKPHDNAPDFVKASLSINRSELIKWLQDQSGDTINVDIKESKKGSWYAQVNEWELRNGQQSAS
jgi:hypothetical protein